MNPMQPFISVIIPCYNEEQNIRLGALDKVARYLERQKFRWEVLIVDDGSTDQSLELIKKFVTSNRGFKLIAASHQGKASTVVSGIQKALGEFILFTDLDQATPLDQVEKLLPWFNKGFTIVIGSRKNRRSGAPLVRRLMGPGFMMIRNLILGLGTLEDTQCGFKMFKAEMAINVVNHLVLYKKNLQASGSRVTAGFDVEMLFVALQLGYKIKEVHVEWHYVDSRRVSPLMDSVDALIDIFKIRIISLRGGYVQ